MCCCITLPEAETQHWEVPLILVSSLSFVVVTCKWVDANCTVCGIRLVWDGWSWIVGWREAGPVLVAGRAWWVARWCVRSR